MKLITKTMVLFLFTVISTQFVFADEPPTYTIAEIQQSIENGGNIYEGDRVRIVGVTTCETGRFGYSITVVSDPGGGEWGSIMIYDRDQRLDAARGDEVTAVGVVTEYYDKTEIVTSDETEFPPVVTGGGSVPPAIATSTGSAWSESLESCLIELQNVQVLSAPDDHGNIAIDDGSGEFTLLLRKTDEPPAIGFVYQRLAGINDFHWGEFKIRPRDEYDWDSSGEPTPTPNPNTPTPTPTGGPSCDPTLEIYFEGHDAADCFRAGDMFEPMFNITNECMNARTIDLYIALEVAGYYYFWPTWTQDIDHAQVDLQPEEQRIEAFIDAFPWPSGVGAFSGLHFYAVMTVPETFDLVGELAMLEFCYE